MRELDRQWCGEDSMKASMFGRDASCRIFRKQCGFILTKINRESCAEMVRKAYLH